MKDLNNQLETQKNEVESNRAQFLIQLNLLRQEKEEMSNQIKIIEVASLVFNFYINWNKNLFTIFWLKDKKILMEKVNNYEIVINDLNERLKYVKLKWYFKKNTIFL